MMSNKTKRALGLGALGLFGVLMLLALRAGKNNSADGEDWVRRKYSTPVTYDATPKTKSGKEAPRPAPGPRKDDH
jgi:hypothetical protein